jgi:cell division septation protein DedD
VQRSRNYLLILLAAAGVGCDREAAARSPRDTTWTTREIPAVAFRLPARGGALGIYSLPSLEHTAWGAGGRISGARSAIGVDIQGRRLLYRDSAGGVASFDLVSMRERSVAPRNAIAALGSDGALLAIDPSGAITESQHWGSRPWPSGLGRGVREVFAAPGGRLIAVRSAGGDSLAIATRESGISRTTAAPSARDRAPSYDGDAVAFATDSGVLIVEQLEDQQWFVALQGSPRGVSFSPSGHRIYVALGERGELAVIDRFTRELREAIALPGPASELRMDPWGRAILVRPADSSAAVWVVGIADRRLMGELHTSWRSDLPTVSESGVLLSREGGALIARAVRTLDSLGAVEGGGADIWFTGRWVQRSAAAVRAEAAPPAAPAPRTGTESRAAPPRREATPAAAPRAVQPAAEPRPAGNFYAQVTSTRFPDGARALADSLRREGYPAVVIEPRPSDTVWRVMVGPWYSREAADSVGRAMGRPYFVLDRSRQ